MFFVIDFIIYLQLQEKMQFFLSVEEEHIMVRTAIRGGGIRVRVAKNCHLCMCFEVGLYELVEGFCFVCVFCVLWESVQVTNSTWKVLL